MRRSRAVVHAALPPFFLLFSLCLGSGRGKFALRARSCPSCLPPSEAQDRPPPKGPSFALTGPGREGAPPSSLTYSASKGARLRERSLLHTPEIVAGIHPHRRTVPAGRELSGRRERRGRSVPHFVLFPERSEDRGGRGSRGTSWIGLWADAFSAQAEERGCARSLGGLPLWHRRRCKRYC